MTYYPITEEEDKRIENNFTYHPPISGQADKYESIRASAKKLALMMTNLCPPSRERSLALTDLESAVMWANAAIARNETEKLDGEK